MLSNNEIMRVTDKNWQEFKYFLGYGMLLEFPQDEQLTIDQILHRVATPEEHDGKAKHIVNVIQSTEPKGKIDYRGFIIYHIYQSQSGPFALIEYTAGVGKNKRQKYGSKLVDEVKKSLLKQGVEQIVIETELVPRIVENPVHTDLEAFEKTYTKTGNLWTISKGVSRWDGVDQRDNFWENMGFGIIHDLAYCQPDLVEGLKERRVPLDPQVANTSGCSISQIDVSRVKDILEGLARHNYDLGLSSDSFVQTQSTTTYSGKNLTDGSITKLEVLPYSQLLKKSEVVHALKLHNLESRYKK